MAVRVILVVVGALALAGCDTSGPESSGNAPADHTVRVDGISHKSGLQQPLRAESGCSNAICHGVNLRGGSNPNGSTGPSCFTCHGQKWSAGAIAFGGPDRKR